MRGRNEVAGPYLKSVDAKGGNSELVRLSKTSTDRLTCTADARKYSEGGG
jgi:hypothetical protein